MKTQDIVVGMVVWYKFNESALGTGGEIVKVFEQAGEKYFDVRYSRTDQICRYSEISLPQFEAMGLPPYLQNKESK